MKAERGVAANLLNALKKALEKQRHQEVCIYPFESKRGLFADVCAG